MSDVIQEGLGWQLLVSVCLSMRERDRDKDRDRHRLTNPEIKTGFMQWLGLKLGVAHLGG